MPRQRGSNLNEKRKIPLRCKKNRHLTKPGFRKVCNIDFLTIFLKETHEGRMLQKNMTFKEMGKAGMGGSVDTNGGDSALARMNPPRGRGGLRLSEGPASSRRPARGPATGRWCPAPDCRWCLRPPGDCAGAGEHLPPNKSKGGVGWLDPHQDSNKTSHPATFNVRKIHRETKDRKMA